MFADQGQAQSSVEVLDQRVDYSFDEFLHFVVHFESVEVMQEGFVFYQFPGGQRSWVFEGDLSGNNTLEVQIPLVAENKPKPFTQIEYWFRLASDHGDISESQHYTFFYDDNRYVWQTMQSLPFLLYWHNGNAAFAESVLAAARQGVTRARLWLAMPAPAAVTLRVYDSAADVQLIAQEAGIAWQAGHTDPAAGIILLSLTPDQSLEVQRQVPHEIAHLVLYQSLGADAYQRLPVWLNEGIASNVEVYSDPVQMDYLELANSGNTLIPFFSLCQAFPQDSASARLAYAQSASFVRYIHEQYKPAGFALFVNAFLAAEDCVSAPFEVFGKDLIALDAEWRAATFAQEGPADWLGAVPWLPIFSSAAVALGLFLLLRFMASRRN
ncbi:MAG: peptidase MA family metallohydrolase [Anaerolineales bacterium]